MKSLSAKKPKNKKWWFVVLGTLVVAIGGGAYVWLAHPFTKSQPSNPGPRPVNSIDYSPATRQEQQDSTNAKQKAIQQQQNQSQPPAASGIYITVSRASQVGNGQALNIRTIVNGAVNGNCSITLTATGQQTVTKTAPIAALGTYYTCNTDIPASEFGASGTWALSITAKSGSSSSATATQNVTITK